MPIHINLLAETKAAEESRRRDPVKRSLFIGISITAIFIAWGMFVEVQVALVNAQVTGINQQVDAHTNNFQVATGNMRKISEAKNKIDALNKLQQARFLQGNLMDALQHATVDGVQLTRLRLSQNYSTIQHEIKGKPGPSLCVEDISLRLDARDFSANPGDQIGKFTDALAGNSYFQAMLGKTNTVHLVGTPSSLQGDGSDHYVTFSLECQFPTKTR